MLAVLAWHPANAQVETTAGAEVPADEFSRGTPRRSADGFLRAIEERDMEKAAEYLDLRELRGEASELTGVQLARRLGVIIKRANWVDVDVLTDDAAGRSNDNLPSYRDSIGVVAIEGKEVRLLMQRVPRDDGVSIWKVSNATVSQIPQLYATYGYSKPIEDLRRNLPDVSFLGYELFKWVAVLSAAALVYLLVFLVPFVIRSMAHDPQAAFHQRVTRFLRVPFAIWVVLMTINLSATSLGRSEAAEALQRLSPIPVLITLWMLFVGVNLLRDIYANHLLKLERPGTAVLLRPASNALKLMIGIGAALVYLEQLGVNITTVLAGLGVGGIAVALALQKPMEDVFGAITLYTQQPMRVGDFCKVGAAVGTIEEIGLRTTRLRTLANTLIAIPNARLANEPIDNISARSKILYRPTIRLRYDATPAQLQQILKGIRDYLSEHERVLHDGQRVRFIEIADDALLIEVFAHIDTKVWAEYLELAEGINIRILEIVAQAGTSLSLPARTLHVEQSGRADSAAIV
jgi:MscS family membrane protein